MILSRNTNLHVYQCLKTTFRLVDEMLESKIVVDATTLLHLLIGCASDKEAGYKHAIEVRDHHTGAPSAACSAC